MNTHRLDRRLYAYRDEIADARLRGRVEASRFAIGTPMTVAAPVADMRTKPTAKAGLGTQLLLGDTVRVFDQDEGWAWAQADRDQYVGYVPLDDLKPHSDPTGDHCRVSAPRTFVYAEPDLKRAALQAISIGSRLVVTDTVEHRGTLYARLHSGAYCIANHLQREEDDATDYVAIAESLLMTPYLWGGATAFGIDCSGLVQLSMLMTGRPVPRDSDMQEAAIGTPIDAANGLERGDLVFWNGHVGIMQDAEQLLHANAHTMTVTSEPLSPAIERIDALYGAPTSYRRP